MRPPAPAKAKFPLFLPVIIVHTILLGAASAGVEKRDIPELDHIRSMVADEDARIRLKGLTWLGKWVVAHPEQRSTIVDDKKIMADIREAMLNPAPPLKDSEKWDDDSEKVRAIKTRLTAWGVFFELRRKEAIKLASKIKSEVAGESPKFARALDGLLEMYRTTISIDLGELSFEETMSVLRLLAKSPHPRVRQAPFDSVIDASDRLLPGEATQVTKLLGELYEEETKGHVRYAMFRAVVAMGEGVSGSKEFLLMVANSKTESKRVREMARELLDRWGHPANDE